MRHLTVLYLPQGISELSTSASLIFTNQHLQDGAHIRSNDHNFAIPVSHYTWILLPHFSWRHRRSNVGVHHWGGYGPCTQLLQVLIPQLTEPQPNSRSFDVQSAPLAFLAAVLFVWGISDLVSVSLPEEISQYHWGSQGMLLLCTRLASGLIYHL